MTGVQPRENSLKVFVSYSRKDFAFAERIVSALEERGVAAKIDTRDLPTLEDWRRELLSFIREADAVVFIVSPNSISSPVCAWEVEQVTALNKRLAPIVLERVADDGIPEGIARINYLFFDPPNDFDAQADRLAAALQTDLAWVKEHTRLGELARRWNERNRPTAMLLRSQEIEDAEKWISSRPRTAPEPTGIQQQLIASSRRTAIRRQRYAVFGSLVAAAIALGLAGVAYWQRGEAASQRATAIQERDTARANQSRLLGQVALGALKSGSLLHARLLSIEALPGDGPGEDKPLVSEAESAFRIAANAPQEIFRFETTIDEDEDTPPTKRVAARDTDVAVAEYAAIAHYDVISNKLTRVPFEDRPLIVHISSDRQLIVLTSRQIIAISTIKGENRRSAPIAHSVSAIKSSPNGAFVLVSGGSEWTLLATDTATAIKHRADVEQADDAIVLNDGSVMFVAKQEMTNALFRYRRQEGERTLFQLPEIDKIRIAIDGQRVLYSHGATNGSLTFRDIESTTENSFELPNMGGQYGGDWREMIVSVGATQVLACEFRSPICVQYNATDKDSEPTRFTHGQQAVPVFVDESGDSVTSDGTLHFWSPWSRGTYEMVVTSPSALLKPIGVPARARYMPIGKTAFLTYAVMPNTNKLIIQGWRKIDRRYAPLTSPLSYLNLAKGATRDGLWPFAIGDGLHLLDLRRGEKRVVKFDAAIERDNIVAACRTPAVVLMRRSNRLSVVDVSGPMRRPLSRIPLELVTAKSAVILCGERRIVFTDGNRLWSWSIRTDELRSVDLGYSPQHLLIAGATESVVVHGTAGEVNLMNGDLNLIARGVVGLKRESDRLAGEIIASCASKERLVLFAVRSDERSGPAGSLYSIAIEGDKLISPRAPSVGDAWLVAFSESCNLMAHVGYRTRKGGVFNVRLMQSMFNSDFDEAEYWGIDYESEDRKVILLGGSGALHSLNLDEDLPRLVRSERKLAKVCLTPQERATYQLQVDPPRWCITGAGRELQREKSEWVGVPPFDSPEWQDRLLERQARSNN